MSKTSSKGKYFGTPFAARGVGGQLWQHYGKLFGTHRAAAGRAQLVVDRPPQGADIRVTLGDFFSFRVYFFLEKKFFGPRDKKDPSRACQNIVFFEKNRKFS